MNTIFVNCYLLDDLPDGEYKGKWGGYIIELENGKEVRTEYGVRTFNVPVVIMVKDNKVIHFRNDD